MSLRKKSRPFIIITGIYLSSFMIQLFAWQRSIFRELTEKTSSKMCPKKTKMLMVWSMLISFRARLTTMASIGFLFCKILLIKVTSCILSLKARKISLNYKLGNWVSLIMKNKWHKMKRLSTNYCNTITKANTKRITKYSLIAKKIKN